jgi:hypothetical protein
LKARSHLDTAAGFFNAPSPATPQPEPVEGGSGFDKLSRRGGVILFAFSKLSG